MRCIHVRPLEHELPQNVEFLLFKGVHKYDLSYSKSGMKYTLLALRAREVYWILDSKFARGRI